ncbi:DUF1774-domain-containing protein [Ascobolus immersus RN42]|uniref:DUF1774-domain-containing protein n=1 Tax=Ascobolus immersus RN42 TaxID=1160509 RepID=A0A3N4IPJ4_ASCIM|nr:DUF1774-domain-containing protein [Ascobolus immersus RN42]
MAFANPFSKDSDVHYKNLKTYRVLTLLSFLFSMIVNLYYSAAIPFVKHSIHSTWSQSDAHPTPFTINHIFVAIFWVYLWLNQAGYIWHLYASSEDLRKTASGVGSHFIVFNILQGIWAFLWVNGHFWWSEAVLVLNFVQQCSLYFRQPTTPRYIHMSAVSLPIVWLFFAVLWNGAVMVHCHDLACRIVANVAVWGIAVYAGFFLMVYQDYSIGFGTAFLAAGLGVAQFFTKLFALQWIFAFTIMSLVFVATLLTISPAGERIKSTDRERAPLLQEA